MAVMIKTLTRTNVDAGAVFRDPTGKRGHARVEASGRGSPWLTVPSPSLGEMQGTVHRLLLEERQGELRPGSVLLLKQVGDAEAGCPAASRRSGLFLPCCH